jgi:hypothetical protein
VATLTGVDTSTLNLLRVKLEALNGVERVLVDEEAGSLWVLTSPDAERAPLEIAAKRAIMAVGLAPTAVPIEIATRAGKSDRHRVRLEAVRSTIERDGRVAVTVSLEWHGSIFEGHSIGEKGLIELRTAATAALNALEALTGEDLGLRLIGIKPIRAFDQELMVASLYRPGTPPQRLVGAVLASEDPHRSAAVSVLNAINRTLGNFLATGGG